MAMTYQQAASQARQLKRQGSSWKDIEIHLEKAGYISERTHRPIKELAIRQMIDRTERQEREEAMIEAKEEKMYVTTEDSSFKEDFKTLMTAGGFSPEMRLKLLGVLLENAHPNVVSSANASGDARNN